MPTSDMAMTQPSCTFAVMFAQYADRLCCKAAKPTSAVGITQAKNLLINGYFEWRRRAPLRYRCHLCHLGKNGCTNSFHIFAEAYQRLELMESSISPPAFSQQGERL